MHAYVPVPHYLVEVYYMKPILVIWDGTGFSQESPLQCCMSITREYHNSEKCVRSPQTRSVFRFSTSTGHILEENTECSENICIHVSPSRFWSSRMELHYSDFREKLLRRHYYLTAKICQGNRRKQQNCYHHTFHGLSHNRFCYYIETTFFICSKRISPCSFRL